MNLHMPAFEQARIMVVGDLMLDRYWSGATARISPEAPVPVVHVNEVEERPGGAANVAVNLAQLGVQTRLLGIVGEDEAGHALEGLLAQARVSCDFARSSRATTITKLRVLSRHQQLLRLDFEQPLEAADTASLPDRLAGHLAGQAVVVLSDYGKGALAEVARMIRMAREARVPVLVDPKGRDFERYRGTTLLTPNLAEFEAVVGPCPHDDRLISRGEKLREDLDLEALLITLSERGMLLLRAGRDPLHLPTRAREVYDVTGAGDTVIAVIAAALGAGQDLAQAATLANLAAGIVVGKLGTGCVTPAELRAAVRGHQGGWSSLLSEADLLLAVQEARAQGERVVMTNGCFDILHAGHVAYLEQARRLGDRLIVAVNDDASVRRLKGHGRPVNGMERRMAVLAGLASVDWVVPFREDTPERLIRAVSPDVLVKGGDYRPEEIVGGDHVRALGGRVEVLPFLDGVSTTRVIDRIRGS
ncbi:bifunctional D-glycero-beta-D-manno-heptose-7-phosphate kinase/D-glycero-beta-D-manno-heptose 1-phosphate adenylyltransferase HldE [Ectothiorhodospira sp. PHS-1]|uniref:bifunctional D-glycero-beta-D-manno-heptose-7-phosphate kinase/D-glycero-beta-D-manno-heptose 1-phosphate adenylyltransferase HldE n=1 Tax=Ectothiorhodospira sp. PHS-1 TaxID=519989 RepID=UPI0002E8EA07|nr:bifunctional D-glycero-beta-D-manno-heptose-7-phosphate kinase/D-glycero-beta-D-manno-heptose 1-phosphate adenylyltransferase HldE [Ectothiorhodospira sp. PHS-1]